MRYRVVVADPPWPFRDHLPSPARGASKHYGTMTMRDIKTFTLPQLYQNSVLFLWRVAAMQQEALDVLSAWDYELKTELVWTKRTVHNKRAFGMGRIVRAEHEVCLIATSGKPIIKAKNIRSTFDAPLNRHSEKPEEFYRIVEQLVDGPYVELFARRHRPGWTCLGDEL